MQRTVLYAKLHRVTVSHVDMSYVGSVTIDQALLEGARLLPGDPLVAPDGGVGLMSSGTPRGQR